MLPQGCWVVCDEIFCEGRHTVVSRIQLDPQVEVSGNHSDWQLKQGTVKLNYHHEGLPVSVEHGPCSLRYNELQDHKIFASRGRMHGSLFQDELFYGEDFRLEPAEVMQPGPRKAAGRGSQRVAVCPRRGELHVCHLPSTTLPR